MEMGLAWCLDCQYQMFIAMLAPGAHPKLNQLLHFRGIMKHRYHMTLVYITWPTPTSEARRRVWAAAAASSSFFFGPKPFADYEQQLILILKLWECSLRPIWIHQNNPMQNPIHILLEWTKSRRVQTLEAGGCKRSIPPVIPKERRHWGCLPRITNC